MSPDADGPSDVDLGSQPGSVVDGLAESLASIDGLDLTARADLLERLDRAVAAELAALDEL